MLANEKTRRFVVSTRLCFGLERQFLEAARLGKF